MECADGTGATLAWPLLHSAASLLTELADGEDSGPSHFVSTRGSLEDSGPSGQDAAKLEAPSANGASLPAEPRSSSENSGAVV